MRFLKSMACTSKSRLYTILFAGFSSCSKKVKLTTFLSSNHLTNASEPLIEDIETGHLISLLMDVFEKPRLAKQIREITMHTLLRIVRFERYNRYFAKGSFLTLLVSMASNKNLSPEINKTAVDMLTILVKTSDISQYLNNDEDYHRLNLRNASRVQVATLPQVKTFSGVTIGPNSPVTTNAAFQLNNQGDFILPEVTKQRRPSLRSNSTNRMGTPRRNSRPQNFDNSSVRMEEGLEKTPGRATHSRLPNRNQDDVHSFGRTNDFFLGDFATGN